jgi:competence protein ComEC
LFVIAVLSFAAGIYIQAIRPFPLNLLFAALLIPLIVVPFIIAKKQALAVCLMIPLFACAGMVRLGMVTAATGNIIDVDEEKVLWQGVVLEASPNTKILKLESPVGMKGVKAVFRTPEAININDRIRVFGHIRELSLTFNNPSLVSWKWLKRQEGINYELRGTLVSSSPGVNHIHAWRNWLKERIDQSGARYPGIIKALTIGDTTGLDEGTKTLFLKTGTSHILAISGSNIGIITAFFFFIARTIIRRWRRMRLRGDDIRYAALLAIPFAFMFMITAGSSIPTIRATIMITVFMLSLFFERGRHTINAIFFSALVILLLFPHSVFTPSFQLTFMSVLFIVIATERFYPYMRIENRILKWFLSSILMTVAASVGTLPAVIYHFYGVNPLSIIHNLVAIPLMCILAMPLSLAGLILPWGDYVLRLSGEIIALTIYILERLNAGYIYPVIRPTLFECMLYLSLILSAIYVQKRLVSACLIFIILPLSMGHAYHAWSERFHNKGLCVNFLDVGLGDSMIVEAPEGTRILIDGGGLYRGDFDMGKSIITPILLSKKILTIDYVINTHPHGDHAGGLFTILNTFKVRRFVTGAYFMREGRFLDLLALLKEKGIPVDAWKKSDHITFTKGMKIDVMNPGRLMTPENPNDASLVLKITHRENAFLLTGDIGSGIEEGLVLEGVPLKARIMKIPHHGSRHSSSLAFICSVGPDTAILSVGKGIRGLPGEDALNVYKSLSIPVLRTDVNGFIRVCSDGSAIRCETFR